MIRTEGAGVLNLFEPFYMNSVNRCHLIACKGEFPSESLVWTGRRFNVDEEGGKRIDAFEGECTCRATCRGNAKWIPAVDKSWSLIAANLLRLHC